MINQLLRTFGLFDLYGLKHSIDHLDRIKDDIPFWPREVQAKYVDIVTKRNVYDVQFLIGQFMFIDPASWFYGDVNATTIGNLAYISIHGSSPFNATANLCLSNYKSYLETKLQSA